MMMHQASGKNCTFIFSLPDQVNLKLDYNGLLWETEKQGIDSLRDFSDACTGFNITSFKRNGNLFIAVAKKEFTFEEYLQIFFESMLTEDFLCAFHNDDNNTWDDFSIPTDALGFLLNVNAHDRLVITSIDCEDDDFSEEDDYDDYIVPVASAATTTNQDEEKFYNDTVFELKQQLELSSAENEELKGRISDLESENRRLLSQFTQTTNLAQAVADDTTTELERLKTLISQLVDREYEGDYIRSADEQINDATRKMEEVKRLKLEKSLSLERLKEELSDIEAKKQQIVDEIDHTMELLHKAEMKQSESLAELSVFQEQLNDILDELKIDISTLEMYDTQDGIRALLIEAGEMKDKIESKLKAMILLRQNETNARFNNITS